MITERFPFYMKQFHVDHLRPSMHATEGAIASVDNAAHTSYMRTQRTLANARMQKLDSKHESQKIAFYSACEKVTIARVSQALPAHMNATHEGDLITLPKSQTLVRAYKRPALTLK
jgi:hypothetical protein